MGHVAVPVPAMLEVEVAIHVRGLVLPTDNDQATAQVVDGQLHGLLDVSIEHHHEVVDVDEDVGLSEFSRHSGEGKKVD